MQNPLYTSPQECETAFYDAFEKADLEAMMAVWADDEEIICIHPAGAKLIGHEAVRDSWKEIFRGGPRLSFQITHQHYTRGSMLSIHTVHENIVSPGEPRRNVIVATNAYLLTPRGWRMLLHHASPSNELPPPAPAVTPSRRVLH